MKNIFFVLLAALFSCNISAAAKEIYKTSSITIDTANNLEVQKQKILNSISDNKFRSFVAQFQMHSLPFNMESFLKLKNVKMNIIKKEDILAYLITVNENKIDTDKDVIKSVYILYADSNFISLLYIQTMKDPYMPIAQMTKCVLADFNYSGKLISALPVCVSSETGKDYSTVSLSSNLHLVVREYNGEPRINNGATLTEYFYRPVICNYKITPAGEIKFINISVVKGGAGKGD